MSDPAGHADSDAVLAAFLDSLRRAESEGQAEGSPLGLDALDETDLQGLLARGAVEAGWGCFREVFYPSAAEAFTIENAALTSGRLPRDSERLRADLVLTARPGLAPLDPLAAQREADAARDTLFAEHARREQAWCGREREHAVSVEWAASGCCASEEAVWIEVKCTGQTSYADGVPRPNPRYASELVSGPARDLSKLAADPRIIRAMVALVVFVRDEATASHDLSLVAHRVLDRGLDLAPPSLGGFRIADRVGNGWCGVAVLPLRVASRLSG